MTKHTPTPPTQSYRWPIGFFFALVAVPFASVWFLTQGPKVLDRVSPTYSVQSIRQVKETDIGLLFKDVTFKKLQSCESQGIVYLSGTYKDGSAESEVLMLVEQTESDSPLLARPIMARGETFTVRSMQVIVSNSLLVKMDRFRFMIPCNRWGVGDINAYTNPIVLK